VTRTSYTPYGQLRGADNLALDRGWLGQVEDRADATTGTGTGLTYLNARYYDPVLARFITPDPLMNPADPKTLDPYRYADNNPVVFMEVQAQRRSQRWDRGQRSQA
jgi:RHS repeat-associated protein